MDQRTEGIKKAGWKTTLPRRAVKGVLLNLYAISAIPGGEEDRSPKGPGAGMRSLPFRVMLSSYHLHTVRNKPNCIHAGEVEIKPEGLGIVVIL